MVKTAITAATTLHLGPASLLGLGAFLLVAFLAMLLVSAVVSGRNAAGFAAILEAWAHLLHPGRRTPTPLTSGNHGPPATAAPSGDDQHQHRPRRRTLLEAIRRARPGQRRRRRTRDPRR